MNKSKGISKSEKIKLKLEYLDKLIQLKKSGSHSHLSIIDDDIQEMVINISVGLRYLE